MPPLSEDSRPPLHSVSPPTGEADITWSPSVTSVRGSITTKYPISSIAERGVKFYPLPHIVEIPNRDDYSEEELQSVWYTEKHVHSFMQEATETALRLARRTLRQGECGRGLEELTAKGYRTKMSARAKGMLVVLSEQRRQEKEMINDMTKIAQAYAAVSHVASIQAQDIAAVDALEAQLHQSKDVYSNEPMDEPFDCWAFFSPIKWFVPRIEARVTPVL